MKSKLLRGLLALSLGLTTSVGLNLVNYHRYWNRTIRSVQTVDFNILSHSLPTKLSVLLIQENAEEITKMVNSNYGLFKIVVTDCTQEAIDCSNEKILYVSESYYDDIQVTLSDLLGQPFNILRNPLPLEPEWKFENPHALETIPLNPNNEGQAIGRVYYLRNKPPTFINDFIRRVRRIPEDPLHIYLVTLALSITSAFMIWFFLEERKRSLEIKETGEKNLSQVRRQYSTINNSLNKSYQQSANHLKQLQEENLTLIEKLRQEEDKRINLEAKVLNLESDLDQERENKQNLEFLIQDLYQRIEEENLKIQKSEDQFIQLEEDLNKLRSQRQSEVDRLQALQKIQAINLTDLERQKESLDSLQVIIDEKESALYESRQSVQEYQKRLISLEHSLENHQANLTHANSSIQQREKELTQVQNRLQEQIKLNKKIHSDLKSFQESEKDLKDENKYLLEELESRQIEIDKLNKNVADIRSLSAQKIQESVAEAWQKANDDLNKIVEQNTEEKQQLEEEIEQLILIRESLENENNRLKYRSQQESEEDNDENQSEHLVLSQYKFAIVSGHQNTFEGIQYELETKNKVSQRNIKWIKDRSLGNEIRGKLLGSNFVVVLIGYGGHQETQDAIRLARKRSIDAHLITISKRVIGSNSKRCHQYIEKKVREFIV